MSAPASTPPPDLSPEELKIRRVLPWLVATAFFMEAMDMTILNTAIPTIARSLEVSPLSLKTALTSYALSLALFIPLSGWMAERFGTRRTFSSAIGVFTLGSLACGAAPTLPWLVAARVVQGLGGAMMMPVGRIAIVRTFPKKDVVRAMSFVVIPGLIGPLLGPLLGGLIVSSLHWRVIFLINIPIGIAGLWFSRRLMPDYRSEHPAALDWVGFVLFGGAMVTLSYALEEVDPRAGSRFWLALIPAALFLLSGYWVHARRHPHPLLPLKLFQVRTFRAATIGGFVSRLGMGSVPFLLPLYYQMVLGFSPVHAAALVIPQPLAGITMKAFAPYLFAKLGYRRLLLLNTFALAVGMIAFATIGPGTPVWIILIQAFLYGFFTTLQFTGVNTLLFADLTPQQTSAGSSIGSVVQQLSMSFGVATASLTAGAMLGATTTLTPHDWAHALRVTLVVMGLITFVSLALFLPLRASDGAAFRDRGSNKPPAD